MAGQFFNFSRYFKKDNQGQAAGTVTSSTGAVTSYSGIGNPPTGVAYSGIGNPPPLVKPIQNVPTPTGVNIGKPAALDVTKRAGMDVLSRLTQRANQSLMLSVSKAKELKLSLIDTEHVLWGLLHDSGIYQLISECKVTPSQLQTDLEKSFKSGNFSGQPQFSPRVKRVLEISLATARTLGYEFISPEHILLALSSEGEGMAARTMVKFNLAKETLHQKITGKKEEAKEEEKKRASALEEYTEDLTAKAAAGELDPVVGRSWEIERIIHILSRRTKNNPVLIGDAGVGKTAIVEGLALRIAQKDVPETLLGKRVLLLDLMSLIAGAKHRGEFEERLKNLIKEVKIASGAIILFIDELHNMVGAGSSGEGTMDAGNILKPSLARGELQMIGTTTVTEYRKYIEKDPALERRFQPVLVVEPTTEVAVEMLTALRDKYEAFHRVKISDEAIEAAVTLSQRYISDRFLPDKAVDLIDEAAASVRLPAISLPEEIKTNEARLTKLTSERQEAEKISDKVHVENLTREIDELQKSLTELKEQYQAKKSTTTNIVTAEIIAEIVSRWTKIPLSKLTESESVKLLELENVIHKRLIDQDEAVAAVAEAVRRGRAGLKSNKRPIGSFIFMGPTGVGKTELAKILAEILFGSEEMMVRLDMTEYMEKHEVAKLIGAPPGYVGYEEGGQLTEAVRRRPYSVVLLDEIEKANPDVFNILIQMLDDGRLTDNKGHTISFKNTIIICTSNLGSGIIQEELLKENPNDKIQSASWRTNQAQRAKPSIFKTYTVSPTGREILTLADKYWEKDAKDNQWKKGKLVDYFAGSIMIEGNEEFPFDGIDTHLIGSDGSETITRDGEVWFRTSTTLKKWTTRSLATQMKDHMVINASPDKPDEQLPGTKIDTHALSPTNVEIISLGGRFWKRENLQTKDWTTGVLSEYFQNSELPMEKWDVHLFKPTGEEIIIIGDKYWQRKNITATEWTNGPVKNLFPTTQVIGEKLDDELPVGKRIEQEKTLAANDDRFVHLAKMLMEELRKFFRPELLNRFDEVVIFRPLTKEHMVQIVDLQLTNLTKLLEEQNVAVKVSQEAKAYLAETGFDPVFGARPLRRTIQRLVENQISSLLIKGDLVAADTITIDIDPENKELTFNVQKGVVAKKEIEKQGVAPTPVTTETPSNAASPSGQPSVPQNNQQKPPPVENVNPPLPVSPLEGYFTAPTNTDMSSSPTSNAKNDLPPTPKSVSV